MMSSRPQSLFDHTDTVRPVVSRNQIEQLTQRVMRMTTADTVIVYIRHIARTSARFANNRMLASDNGDDLTISLLTQFGTRENVQIKANQLDDTALRAAVERCEALARANVGGEKIALDVQYQDQYLPVTLWRDTTVQAMTSERATVIPELIDRVSREKLVAAGFVGLMASAHGALTKEGVFAFCDETDTEVTVTARSADGKGSGWSGQAARDWSQISPIAIADKAVEFAKMSVGARAVEPGRRRAILSPAALAQIFRYFGVEFQAQPTDIGSTAFSTSPHGGNRLHQQVFDRRIDMFSDPADPLGGYPNFFGAGYRTPRMQWVERGILKNLAYDPEYAMLKGKVYAESPWSLHMTGGTTTIPQMIAQCEDGIYVNRLSGVEMIDKRTGMMTGTTRDGCFLIRNGKISMPVKNFQILDSPFFFLNRVVALGVPERAAFGYTPKGFQNDEGPSDWPRYPMIVPPIMVEDFNFKALVDAV